MVLEISCLGTQALITAHLGGERLDDELPDKELQDAAGLHGGILQGARTHQEETLQDEILQDVHLDAGQQEGIHSSQETVIPRIKAIGKLKNVMMAVTSPILE